MKKLLISFCVAFGLGISLANAQIPDQLIGEWSFNGNVNSTSTIQTSSSSNITYTGAFNNSLGQVGKFQSGSIVNFSQNIDPTTMYSMCTWVKIDNALTNTGMLFFQNVTAYPRLIWQIGKDGKQYFTTSNSGFIGITGNFNLVDGQPHFICMTWGLDFIPGTRGVVLYVDGMNDGFISIPNVSNGTAAVNARIGQGSNTSTSYNGQMGYFRVFQKELSPTEVNDIYSFDAINYYNGSGTGSDIGQLVFYTGTGINVQNGGILAVQNANSGYLYTIFQILKFLGAIAILAGGMYILNKIKSFIPGGNK